MGCEIMEGMNTFFYYASAIGTAGTVCFLVCLYLLKESIERNREANQKISYYVVENIRLQAENIRLRTSSKQPHIKTVYSGANKEVFFCGLEGQARKDRYKQLVKLLHPDNGGDKQLFQKMLEEYGR